METAVTPPPSRHTIYTPSASSLTLPRGARPPVADTVAYADPSENVRGTPLTLSSILYSPLTLGVNSKICDDEYGSPLTRHSTVDGASRESLRSRA